MKLQRIRLLTIIASVLFAAPTLIVGATSANAATPRCVTSNAWSNSAHEYWELPIRWTSSGSPSTNCISSTGDSNQAVYVLQVSLYFCYNQTNVVFDGIYGPGTKSAVKAAQQKIGVTADGVYGPVTGKKMKWRVNDRNNQYIGCRSEASYF